MVRGLLRFVFAAWLSTVAVASAATEPNTGTATPLLQFNTPELNLRYHALISELRCPKCQNQNLADSDAPIAEDLRGELQRLLNEGYSDEEILQFMTTRYGTFVLYKPPFENNTLLLWGLPAVLLLTGLLLLVFLLRRNRASSILLNNANSEHNASVADVDVQVDALLKRMAAQQSDEQKDDQ